MTEMRGGIIEADTGTEIEVGLDSGIERKIRIEGMDSGGMVVVMDD